MRGIRESVFSPGRGVLVSRILFVDDSRHIREFWRREWERCGHQVTLAASGEEALQAAAEAVPDVAVMDLNLPGIDGVRACTRLAELHPGLPVILYSSRLGDLSPSNSRRAFALVDKAAPIEELLGAVARALGERTSAVPLSDARQAGRGTGRA